MHRINNLEDKVAYHVELNEEVVRYAGRDTKGNLAIITEDMDAAYKLFKSEADEERICIYPFDAYSICDNCYTIVENEEMSIDTETGEQLCDSCLSEF
jgi:hypothetical protein